MSLFLLQTLPLEMLNVYFPHFLLSAFLNFYTKRTVPFVYAPPPYRRGGRFQVVETPLSGGSGGVLTI